MAIILGRICEDTLLYLSQFFCKRPPPIPNVPRFDFKTGGDFCCPRHCFNVAEITTECDGIACTKCYSSCICYCQCTSYMEWYAKVQEARKIEERHRINNSKHKCPNCRCK